MRQRGARVILKDPLAIFSADWLAARFGARVVVIIRHPAAFVASMRAAGFVLNFRAFQNQPRLIEDRLAPFAAEIAAAGQGPQAGIGADTLLWKLLHHHIALLMAEHPDWIFVRHEDSRAIRSPASRTSSPGSGSTSPTRCAPTSTAHHRARRARPAVALRQQAAHHARQPGEHAPPSASG